MASSTSAQPGGRRPAPGELALVQAFINTHFDLGPNFGADLLGSPGAAQRWLSDRGLLDRQVRIKAGELARVVGVRESLRELARCNGERGRSGRSAITALNHLGQGAQVEVRFAASGPRFVAGSGAPGAIGVLLAITAQAMVQGTWASLKVCPGPHCGWAFYDQSRNQTGRWCSMSVCGGRAKARAHYQRSRRVAR